MGKNLIINEQTYIGVEGIGVNTEDGGKATFYDTSGTTVSPETLHEGITARNAAGELITGEAEPKYVENAEAVAQFGDVTYKSVQQALDVAAEAGGGTVTLIADATDGNLTIPSGVTLDLAGFTLTADSVVGLSGSNLVDNSAHLGTLVVPREGVLLDSANSDFPIYVDGTGYKFVTFTRYNQMISDLDADTVRFQFKPYFANDDLTFIKEQLGDGGVDNGVSMVVRTAWSSGSGATITQDYVYSDSDVGTFFSQYAASGGSVPHMDFTPGDNVVDLAMTARFVSDTGVVSSSATVSH